MGCGKKAAAMRDEDVANAKQRILKNPGAKAVVVEYGRTLSIMETHSFTQKQFRALQDSLESLKDIIEDVTQEGEFVIADVLEEKNFYVECSK